MRPLIFVGIGEALYDVFEDGTETVGGAPLNVTVHAHQLAHRLGIGHGVLVSCVHPDRRGEGIVDFLSGLGMSSRHVGRDPGHPTGRVSVFMSGGEPGYQIEPEAAWDYIPDGPGLTELAGRCDAVAFGSLAERSPVSRDTIRRFLQNAPQAIRLYDVNLRRNTLTGEAGYSPEIVEYGCRAATLIKTNRSELFTLLDLLRIPCPADRSLDGIRRGMGCLLEHFPARAAVVTRGAEGTLVLGREGEFDRSTPPATAEARHPVGAGDACSAGILLGTALGWNIPTTMDLANRMGADVAAHPSATPPLSDRTLHFARTRLQASPRQGGEISGQPATGIGRSGP